MATGNSLVSDALLRIGRLASGETATTTELSDGVAELNRMLGTWNAEAGPVYVETLSSLTWAASAASKTIGSSGDFSESRPLFILGAQYRDANGYDFDLDVVSHREYQEITSKPITSSIPNTLAYNPGYPNGTLFVWPVSTVDFNLRLNSKKPIADLTGAGTVSLPPGYEDAIITNLAVRFADGAFAAEIPMTLRELAIDTKTAIVQANIHFRTPGFSAKYPQSWPANQ